MKRDSEVRRAWVNLSRRVFAELFFSFSFLLLLLLDICRLWRCRCETRYVPSTRCYWAQVLARLSSYAAILLSLSLARALTCRLPPPSSCLLLLLLEIVTKHVPGQTQLCNTYIHTHIYTHTRILRRRSQPSLALSFSRSLSLFLEKSRKFVLN